MTDHDPLIITERPQRSLISRPSTPYMWQGRLLDVRRAIQEGRIDDACTLIRRTAGTIDWVRHLTPNEVDWVREALPPSVCAHTPTAIVVPPALELKHCKSCKAPVVWGVTASGQRCPFDVVDGVATETSHFRTCPHAKAWGKTKGKAA